MSLFGIYSLSLAALIFLIHATLPIIADQRPVNGQEYKGALIGKLSSYAHQVAGEVYAIDEQTLLIKEFFYDGLAGGKWNVCFDRIAF